MKKTMLSFTLIVSMMLGSISTVSAARRPETLPDIKGKLIFHSYDDYDDWNSELRMLDFETKEIVNISENITVDNEMNAHFSPDGTMITFMGDDNTDDVQDWDVFLYNLETQELRNITIGTFGESDEEDPKFSPDGTKIVMKSSKWVRTRMVTDLYEIDLNGNAIKRLTNDTIEESMPYYSTDGQHVYYSASTGDTGDIYRININTLSKNVISALPGVDEYYPIAIGPDSVVFTRWISATNGDDQLYMQTGDEEPVPFITNKLDDNNSDFCQIDERYFCFSGTGRDSVGAYDIFVGDLETGRVYSLNRFIPGANTVYEDLGCTYYPN